MGESLRTWTVAATMSQAKLSKLIGLCAAIVSAATAFASAAHAQVIYQGKLVDGLPGPEALYDPDQGQPQALLPEPCEVVFPRLGFPAEHRCRHAGNSPTGIANTRLPR